ncbi:uncharacterized protein J3D65DRAFT_222753 [Phyllosticta citribraziliensis]|uniref:Uncharacterized protein n=1 Tax=Phyllosticta citribraziliensis TaxID=989973 RepID=A0ABR1M4V2_9PEZI
MANFAPPICRDGFVYHGQLFADVGNLNRHPRASIQDLNDLLRPNKPAKDGQSRDQVGHWYFAQLRHYGLPTTKDKNAAKVRLLNALNGGQLQVPKDVKKLESQLKKEYDASNKKAKAELKGAGSTPVSQTTKATPSANKRKRTDDEAVAAKAPAKKKTASNPTPATSTINVGRNGDVSINIAYQEFLGTVGDSNKQSTPKKAATKKTSATAKSTTTAKNTTTAKTTTATKNTTAAKKTATAKSTAAPKSTTSKAAAPKTTSAKTQNKTTAKSTAPGSTKSTGTAGSARKPTAKGPAVSKKNVAPKDKGSSSAKTQGANKKTTSSGSGLATQIRTTGVIKQENDFLNSSGPATPFDHGISQFYNHDPNLDYITGFYDIHCSIEEDFPAFCENGCRMMLCRERDSGRVWGSYSFGPWFGIIKSDPGPTHFSLAPVSLGWRAKDVETGQLQFGRGCTGNMTFESPEKISGWIFGLYEKDVEFYGRRRNGPANCGFVPSEFETEWASYPAIAYGREGPSHGDLSNGGFSSYGHSNNRHSNDGHSDEGHSYSGNSHDGYSNEGYSDDGHSQEGYPDDGLSEDDGPDGELYDDDGHLRPTGRYEDLMRESLGGW